MEAEYIHECIKISNYSLSASNCLYKIINYFEEKLKVEEIEEIN